MYSPLSLTPSTHPLLQAYSYKIRINLNVVDDTILEDIQKFAKDKLKGSYIFSKEVGKTTQKPHIHGAFTYQTSDETTKRHLRQYIKFTNTSKLTNNDWSCIIDKAPETWENYERYCVKEGNVFCSSYSQEHIQKLHTEYWAKNEEIKKAQRSVINHTQKVKVQDRETKFKNIIEKIEKDKLNVKPEATDYEVDGPYQDTPVWEFDVSLNYVMDLVIEEYQDCFFTSSLLEPIVNRVMLHFRPKYWKGVLKDKLMEKLIPRNS